ncbi:MAG: hypothetical protein ACLRUN_13595, partial [Christensenellales bacterium]
MNDGIIVANQNTYRFAHGDHLGENIITILTESCGGNVNGGKQPDILRKNEGYVPEGFQRAMRQTGAVNAR